MNRTLNDVVDSTFAPPPGRNEPFSLEFDLQIISICLLIHAREEIISFIHGDDHLLVALRLEDS